MLKKFIKALFKILGVYRLKRVSDRRSFALSYYSKQIDNIKKWAWLDTEDSNFYYKLTPLNRDQLAHAISATTDQTYQTIESYFTELEGDDELREHLKKGIINADYGKNIVIDYGRRLGWYAFVRCLKPRIVIETGVSHGVGACIITSALLRNKAEGCPGYYYGTEIDPTAGKLLNGKYADIGQILYGDSINSLDVFKDKIDLFINDSDHSSEYEYKEYVTIADKLSENAVILGDNSHVTDKLSQFSKEKNRKFIFFSEQPQDHWYPGAGIGISFTQSI